MILLVIAAHPDDELDAGGLLCRAADSGHTAHILFTTRGEAGSPGDPPLCRRDQVGALREGEARASAAVLGAQAHFLPFADPPPRAGRLSRVEASPAEFSAAIQAVLADLRPDVVITHGSDGEYGHAQHLYTHAAVFQALRALWPWQPQAALTWCADLPGEENVYALNRSDPADLRVEIAAWAGRKRAAFQCHRSQYPGMLRYCRENGQLPMTEQAECYRRWRGYDSGGDAFALLLGMEILSPDQGSLD